MELDVQDWLIVLGAFLIVGVLLDAYRRFRNERRNPYRMRSRKFGPGDGFQESEEPPVVPSTELPTGKARVIVRDPDEPAEGERAPQGRIEPRLDPAPPLRHTAPVPAPAPAPAPAPSTEIPVLKPEHPPAERTARPAGVEAPADEVVLIRVFARGETGFVGTDLMRIFKECDVRFGEMRIFHRHEEARGQGAVQFSVVNVVEPGTFDPQAMEGFSTRGLGFFMRLPGPAKPLEAFDCMLETARTVARYLDGELRDDSNSVFTQQTGEHCRQRIREFALRARTRR